MKLTELLGVKKLHALTLHELITFMRDFTPFKPHGFGTAGSVFLKGDKIYKFWFSDMGYEKFLRYVQKNPSPYVPKLLSPIKELHVFHNRPKSLPNKVRYIVLEKLSAFDTSKSYHVGALADGSKLELPGHFIFEAISNGWTLSSKEKFLSNIMQELANVAGHKRTLLSKVKVEATPEFAGFIGVVYDVKKLAGRDFDLISSNMMLRGSIFVLTDPILVDDDIDFNTWIKELEESPNDRVTGPRKYDR